MSYILDALRRADAERQRGAVPGLHARPLAAAVADAAPDQPVRVRRLAAAAALLAGLALAVLAGWWLRPAGPPGPVPTASTAAAATAPSPRLLAEPAAATPAAAQPSAALAAPPVKLAAALPLPAKALAPSVRKLPAPVPVAEAATLPAAAPPQPASAAPTRLPTLAELPEAQRREVGSLSLGGAVHAEQPAMRIVILNGQVFHEGDRLAPDLLVQQIRLKSVVLSLRGQRFELPL